MIYDAAKKVFLFLFVNLMVTILTFVGVLSIVFGEFPPPVISISKQLTEIRKFAKNGFNLKFYKDNRIHQEAMLKLADGLDAGVATARYPVESVDSISAPTPTPSLAEGLLGQERQDPKIAQLSTELKVEKMRVQTLQADLQAKEEEIKNLKAQLSTQHKGEKPHKKRHN